MAATRTAGPVIAGLPRRPLRAVLSARNVAASATSVGHLHFVATVAKTAASSVTTRHAQPHRGGEHRNQDNSNGHGDPHPER